MDAKDYNTSIVVNPDGRVFSASEDTIRHMPAGPETHTMLAQFSTQKHEHGSLMASADIQPRTVNETYLTKPMERMLTAAANKSQSKYEMGGQRELQQLQATEGSGNAENLTHLQLIRLFPQIQGKPEVYFFLEEAFVKREIPMLEYREPFYDTVQTAEYLDRLEQSKATATKYDEIVYDLKKLVDKVYTPIEDIYRTIINPQNIDLSQIYWGFKRKRNLSALAALKEIGNQYSTVDPIRIGKLTAGNVHSDNRAASEFNDAFNSFLKTNDVSITHTVWNPADFAAYSENTWTNAQGPFGINPVRLAGGGVVPMPGVTGVTSIVDVAVPVGKVYAVNKPFGLRLGEGPKVMRRYYDEERDASAIKMLDFHEFIAVNSQLTKLKRKFGMTIDVDKSADGSGT